MRKTFHLGEPNRSRRIEDKLTFMEGTAEQLLEENHRLKTQLFVRGRAHQDLLFEFVNGVRTAKLCELARDPEDTPVEEFRKATKQVILTYGETKRNIEDLQQKMEAANRNLVQTADTLTRSEALVRSKAAELEQYRRQSENAYITRANNLRTENHRQQTLIKELKGRLDDLTERTESEHSILISKVQSLSRELALSQRQRIEQLRDLSDSHCQEIRSLKQEFEQSKISLIESYRKVIEVKKEENEALMKALNKQQPTQPNIYSNSFLQIELRDELSLEVDCLRKLLSEKQQIIQQHSQLIRKDVREIERQAAEAAERQKQICSLLQKQAQLYKSLREREQQIGQLDAQLEQERRDKKVHDESLGRKWEQQIEKVIMDHQIKLHEEQLTIRSECEKRYSTQIIGLNCEIMTHKQKQEELHGKISKFVFEINQLEEQKADRDATIVRQEEEYQRMKAELKQVIVDKQHNIEALKQHLHAELSQIQLLKQQIARLNGVIQKLVEQNKRDLASAAEQRQQLIQVHQSQLAQQKFECELEQDQALAALKEQLIDHYESIIQRLKADYQSQLQNLRLSRDLIVTNLQEQKQQLVQHHDQQIDKLNMQYRQLKWSMESRLREQRAKHKEECQKVAADMLVLKIDLGRETKINEQHVAKIHALETTIVDNGLTREKLLAQIRTLKLSEENLTTEVKNLNGTVQQKGIEIKRLEEEVKSQQLKYSSVISEIEQARSDLRKQMMTLQTKHDRMQVFYKSQSRKLEKYIVSRPRQQNYIKEIEQLREERSSLDDSLVKCEAQLIKMKQVSKYKDGELENLKEKFRHIRVESTRQPAHTRHRTEHSGLETEHDPLSSQSQQHLLNRTAYQKFSTSRKNRRQYKVVQISAFKGGIANYTLVNSIKQRFRLNSPLAAGRPHTQSKP